MKKWIRRLFHTFIVLALIGSGIFGMKLLMAKKSQLERKRPPKPVPIVQAVQVKTGPRPVNVTGEGTVRSLREIHLVPQVGGKVVRLSAALVSGGEFKRGERLLTIDPEDYRLAVTLAKAKVKSSESTLKTIQEEAAVAREEWRIHRSGRTGKGKEPPPLVAKEPQLKAAMARLEGDKADLRKALLSLERTELRAPFNGRVREENVGLGQYVTHGQALATLYATDAVEVMIPLEDEDLSWFHVPGFTPGNGSGSRVKVKARIAGQELRWEGEVVRSEGKIDERTRMINVVVRVNKPYARKPPLAIGLFVKVEIEGITLPDAALIPRSALRQDRMVWVVRDGRLTFRKVDVARIDGDRVIIKSGLGDGEMVVVSSLKAATDRMNVKIASPREDQS